MFIKKKTLFIVYIQVHQYLLYVCVWKVEKNFYNEVEKYCVVIGLATATFITSIGRCWQLVLNKLRALVPFQAGFASSLPFGWCCSAKTSSPRNNEYIPYAPNYHYECVFQGRGESRMRTVDIMISSISYRNVCYRQ